MTDQTTAPKSRRGLTITIIVVAVVLLLVFWGVGQYNSMVVLDEQVNTSWSQVENQYQRRADLIPNLVNTVKGYTSHESKTLEAVTRARAAVTEASTPEAKMEASNMLTNTLKTLFAVAESYPDLKANASFQDLQRNLTDTENKIVYARQSFNDCVLMYNNAIETFPGNVVAGSKFKVRQGFEVTDASARQAPQVQF